MTNSGEIFELSSQAIKVYTKYITKSRVLPGLDFKPVQRRVLWSCLETGARFGKGYRKASSIIGHSMMYHPHGDSSLYSTMVNMVNSPNPMLAGRGNFGSIYNDPPAAMRYVETSTSEIFESIYDSSMTDVGDFVDNYDETRKEPVYLITKLPPVLLTGTYGIGIGLVSSLSALFIGTVQNMIDIMLDSSVTEETKYYAYEGVHAYNKIYPKFKIVSRENKKYLNIYQIPKGASIKIINSRLIRELLYANQIVLLDETTDTNVNLFINGPDWILAKIIEDMSKNIFNNLLYWHKKFRGSDYLKVWLEERKVYIKKREVYYQIKDLEKNLVKKALHTLHSNVSKHKMYDKEFQDSVTNTCSLIYETVKHLPNIFTKEEYTKRVLDRPISSIKAQDFKIIDVKVPTDSDVNNIISKEVHEVDRRIFTGYSDNKLINVLSFGISSDIKKYIALRNNEIEVKFSPIPYVINWNTDKSISIIYSDGSSEILPRDFFGVKNNPDKIIVGFVIQGEKSIVITRNNNLAVATRLSYIKEPLSAVFPIKEIEVDGIRYTPDKLKPYITNIAKWKLV